MQRLIGSSNNVVEIRDLTNSTTGLVVTDATVNCTVRDGKGDLVIGQTWPVNMGHVDGGTYRATLNDTLELVNGAWYDIDIIATTPNGKKRRWRMPVKAHSGIVY